MEDKKINPDDPGDSGISNDEFEKETGLKRFPAKGSKEEQEWIDKMSIASPENRGELWGLVKMGLVAAAIFIAGMFFINGFLR